MSDDIAYMSREGTPIESTKPSPCVDRTETMAPRDERRDARTELDRTTDDETRVGFLGSLVPTGLAYRALTCSLEAPDRIVVGRQTPFRFHVRNRLPTSVVLDLPTSRPWGWTIDDLPEAGVGRFDPPEASSQLAFGPRERRTFTGHWDGQVRERANGRDRWSPVPGDRELIVYLAVNDWRERGVYTAQTVRIEHA